MKTIVNSAAVGWGVSLVVFGGVGIYAWHVAYVLHTTGSELIKLLVG